MARTARKHSNSGIYHVMMRGNNRQQIFYSEEDYLHFIKVLGKYKATSGFELYAYCLMGNHVHLLLRASKEPIELIIKRIGVAFVYWYNGKYERTGHLFQDRYKSESVDTDQYFIAALRYILRNPVKAGICKMPEDYQFSSGREYVFEEIDVTDTEFAFSILGHDELREYIHTNSNEQFVDVEETATYRLTDEKAKELIFKEFGTFSPIAGSSRDRGSLNASIRELVRSGVSIRQLSRLSGISKKIIETALKKKGNE